MINIKSSLIKLGDITMFSKGEQINGDLLIKDGQYDYLNGGINPSGKWNSYNVAGNTITISEGGNSSGYVNYMSNNFWCGAHCYYLYNTLCDRKYLYYSLKSQQNRLMGIRSGACMPNIKKNDLANFMLKFHEDDKVQKKIAEIFTELDTCISIKEKQLNNLMLFVKSRFIEMFGGNLDRNITLKEVSTKGPQNGFYKKDAEINGTIPIIKMKQLFANEAVGEARDCDKVALTEKELENFKLTSRDLLFGRRSLVVEGAGKCRRVGRLEKNMIFESSLLRITLNEELLLPRFLQIWLETEEGKNSISSIRAVTTIAGIKGSDLARLKVPTPPISLQKSFLDFVAQVDKSKLAVQQSLDELETLKKSLMQQYFG